MGSVFLSEDTVPSEYRTLNDQLYNLGKDCFWDVSLYSKYEPDEKDVRRVKLNNQTIGFMIPILSVLSLEHDFSEDTFFRRAAFEAYSSLKRDENDKELDERTYVLVCWSDGDERYSESISLNFYRFGIYPRFPSLSECKDAGFESLPLKNIKVDKAYHICNSQGYIKDLLFEHLPLENNYYARFMYIYQLFEMFMDILFYKEVDRYKGAGKSISTVRKKISDISSARSLLELLFRKANLGDFSLNMRQSVHDLLGSVNEKNYSDSGEVFSSDVIYDFRNMIVHNYYRFRDDDVLSTVVLEIESKAISLLLNSFKEEEMALVRAVFEERYIRPST